MNEKRERAVEGGREGRKGGDLREFLLDDDLLLRVVRTAGVALGGHSLPIALPALRFQLGCNGRGEVATHIRTHTRTHTRAHTCTHTHAQRVREK